MDKKGFQYGNFKLHLLPMSMADSLTPGNLNDRQSIPFLVQDLLGKVLVSKKDLFYYQTHEFALVFVFLYQTLKIDPFDIPVQIISSMHQQRLDQTRCRVLLE